MEGFSALFKGTLEVPRRWTVLYDATGNTCFTSSIEGHCQTNHATLFITGSSNTLTYSSVSNYLFRDHIMLNPNKIFSSQKFLFKIKKTSCSVHFYNPSCLIQPGVASLCHLSLNLHSFSFFFICTTCAKRHCSFFIPSFHFFLLILSLSIRLTN